MAFRLSTAGDFTLRSSGAIQSDPCTTMLWVRRDSATAFGNIWVIANAGSTLYEGLYLNSAGTNLRIENNNGGADGATTLTVGTWYHVALVRNGNDRTLYLNGVVDATYNNANSFTSAGEGFAGNGLTVFPGYLSALKQYERALTQDEILQEMRTVLPKSVANIYNFSPLFRHTELQNYFGAGWTITGTGLTDDGPPVSWGTTSLLVPFASAGPALEIYGFQGDAFQFGQYVGGGAAGVEGGLDQNIGAITASATGRVTVAGALNTSIGDITVSATGGVRNVGVLGSTIEPVTLSATGTVLLEGVLDKTIGNITVAATGVIGTLVTGQLNTSIGIFTVTATGNVSNTVRTMGASIQAGSLGGGLQKRAYSKSRYRQENMKWPSRG